MQENEITKPKIFYMKVKLPKLPRVKCKNAEQEQLKEAIERYPVTVCYGSAGTGKTFLSLLESFHLINNGSFKKLVLIKSVTVVKGEEIGFIKGTQEDKMEPFMYSYTGNINKIFANNETSIQLKKDGVIEWLPIAYVRGVNIDDSIIIVDEAQNLSLDNFKTIITRIGSNSKIIFLGDVEQIDRRKKSESCLSTVCELFNDSEFVKIVKLEESIRNPIIPKILEVLDSNGIGYTD